MNDVSNPLPIAIILPHAGLELPPETADAVALGQAEVFNEADAFADQLYAYSEAVLYWEAFPYARAVVDVNRPLEPSGNRPGDGVVKRRTSYGLPVWHSGLEPGAALESLLERRYWHPWHERLAKIAADPRVRLVIDAHTMAAVGPSTYDDPASLRPRVMVANWGDSNGERRLGQSDVTAPPALARWWSALLGELLADMPAHCQTGPDSALNHPFRGGANLQIHGGRHQPWLMVEVNRALYIGMQEGDSPPRAADGQALATLRERMWTGILRLLQKIEGGDVSF